MSLKASANASVDSFSPLFRVINLGLGIADFKFHTLEILSDIVDPTHWGASAWLLDVRGVSG